MWTKRLAVFALFASVTLVSAQQSQPQNYVSAGGSSIDFYATGRVQPATVRLTTDRGEEVDIECPSPAEGVIVTSQGGAR